MLDGEAQRRRMAQFSVNEPFIVGMAMRGLDVKVIAAGCMCTEETVYKRLRRYSILGRRKPVDREGAKQKIEVVEIYDY